MKRRVLKFPQPPRPQPQRPALRVIPADESQVVLPFPQWAATDGRAQQKGRTDAAP
ncbi:MAG: hypothetical protein GVY16_04830 [Planctomycetes bacterium]|jgi:hypothetical protein|nr:hypothetical protein [Planctomycetota bacterium]